MRALAAALCVSSLVGCSLDIELPEGRIACTEASDCPAAWFCSLPESGEGGLCYRKERAAARDASDDGQDAGPPDDASGVESDAGETSWEAGNRDMDAAPGADATFDAHESSAAEASADASVDSGMDADLASDATPGTDAMAEAGSDAASDASAQDGSTLTDGRVNHAPTITVARIPALLINRDGPSNASCIASDSDGDSLSYAWSSSEGTFDPANAAAAAFTPSKVGVATLRCSVSDGHGGSAQDSFEKRVYPAGWLAMLPFRLAGGLADESGKGHAGSDNGVVVAEDRAGNPNSAVALTAPGQAITLAGEAAFDLDAFSFVVTLKATSLSAGATVVTKGDTLFGNFTVSIYPENDGSLPRRIQYAHTQAVGGPFAQVLGSYQVTKDKFFQLAITLSASHELRAYVDGTLIHSSTGVAAPQHNDAPVVLGTSALGTFLGVMDEVQFYNRALNADEVMALTTMQ